MSITGVSQGSADMVNLATGLPAVAPVEQSSSMAAGRDADADDRVVPSTAARAAAPGSHVSSAAATTPVPAVAQGTSLPGLDVSA